MRTYDRLNASLESGEAETVWAISPDFGTRPQARKSSPASMDSNCDECRFISDQSDRAPSRANAASDEVTNTVAGYETGPLKEPEPCSWLTIPVAVSHAGDTARGFRWSGVPRDFKKRRAYPKKCFVQGETVNPDWVYCLATGLNREVL